MTTATLSTRAYIPHYGDDEIELTVDYTYTQCHQQLMVHNCLMRIADTEIDVWHHLTLMQRWRIEEECREDYLDRMGSVGDARYEERVQ